MPLLAYLGLTAWTASARAEVGNASSAASPVDVDRHTHDEPPAPAPFSAGALAGVGFPRPISFEVLTKLGGVVGVGIEYGLLPSFTVDGVSASAWAATLDTRVFPFRGAFFIGMRGGYQHISASVSMSSVTENADVSTWFVNPRLGFAWTIGSAFTLATEAGVEIPVTSSFSTTLPDAVAVVVRDSTVVRTLNGVLPTVDLLRVGVMF